MHSIYKYLLITLSLGNLLKIKFNKIYSANYFILTNEDKNLDKRSLYYFDKNHLKFSFNLIRFSSDLNLKVFLKIIEIPNFFCFSLLRELSKNEKNFFLTMMKILKFLKIKKLLLIDDYREMYLFYKISKQLKINTIIYMHGKFTKNSKILKKTFFSKYLVWSNFFLKQLLKANNKYSKKNIKIVGCPYLVIPNKLKKKIKNIKVKKCLILDEDYVNFTEIKNYLDKLIKIKNINLYLKKKITRKLPNEYEIYCKKNNIKIINENLNLGKILEKYKINCLIATTSTGLIECSYYGVIPLKINSKNKFREKEFNEFLRLNLVYSISSPSKINEFFEKKHETKSIDKIKNILWSNHKFSEKNIKKYILNYIKD